jgi:hypothetical protein
MVRIAPRGYVRSSLHPRANGLRPIGTLVRYLDPLALLLAFAGVKGSVRVLLGLSLLVATGTFLHGQGPGPVAVEIDLHFQTAHLVQGGRVVLSTPIASGRHGYLTPTGSFKILDKERKHYSSLYGKIVDARGNTVVADADSAMRVPRGCRFVPAPMHYFLRFSGANGMHAGYLPGYPASHGCVRLPEQNAVAFFNSVDVGTPVTVFGRTPRGRYSTQTNRVQERNRFVDPRFDPYFDRRFARPTWGR